MHITPSLLIPLVSGIYLLSIHILLRAFQVKNPEKTTKLFWK